MILSCNLGKSIGFLQAFLLLFQLSYGQGFQGVLKPEVLGIQQMHPTARLSNSNTQVPYPAAGLNIDFRKVKAQFRIYPDSGQWIEAKVSYIARLQELKPTYFTLNLTRQLSIDSVKFNGIPIAYTYENQVIKFDTLINDTLSYLFTVVYHGKPLNNGYGSFDTVTRVKDKKMVWTLSQTYGGPNWWPCVHSLKDKIDTTDITIVTANRYKGIANGLLKEVYPFDTENRAWRWISNYKVDPYLIAIAAGEYTLTVDTLSINNQRITMYHVMQIGDSLDALTKSRNIVPTFSKFDRLLGTYPFIDEKYGHIIVGFLGGMEHQTGSWMGNLDFELQAHELAHQWMGNKLTTNSYQHLWLHESFATYLTYVAFEGLNNDSWLPIFRRNLCISVLNSPEGTIFRGDTSMLESTMSTAHIYLSGCLMLHALRLKLGDEIFFQGLRNLLNNSNLAYGYFDYLNLVASYEPLTTFNVRRFIENRIFTKGYPKINVLALKKKEELELRIIQPEEQTFIFPLELNIYRNGITIDTVLWIDNQPFSKFSLLGLGDFDSLKINENYISPLKVLDYKLFQQDEVFLFPNPANTEVLVSVNPQIEATHTVIISDITGKVIFEQELSTSLTLNTRSLKPGVYFATIKGNQISKTLRFLVER